MPKRDASLASRLAIPVAAALAVSGHRAELNPLKLRGASGGITYSKDDPIQ